MRGLHGVILPVDAARAPLKHFSLIFDKFHLFGSETGFRPSVTPEQMANFEFLEASNVIALIDDHHVRKALSFSPEELARPGISPDLVTRRMCVSLATASSADVVPLCSAAPRTTLPKVCDKPRHEIIAETVRVAIDCFPSPDESCAWQDILDFKAEMHDQQWTFRRFLHTIATKQQSEAEIRDDIEWSLNEYRKRMEIHQLKASNSLIDVLVITPLEIVESLVKFNWSKIAKGAVQLKRRKLEMMEAEMNAPGCEIAYLFHANRRFGPK